MKNLVFIENGKALTDSLTVAEVFEKQHKNVLRDIKELECSVEFRRLNFEPTTYRNHQNRKLDKVLITQDGFTFLAMGYTGKIAAQFKEAYIREFRRMEETLKQPRVLSDKEQLMASMKLTIESVENIKKLDTRMDQLETKVDSQITLDYGEQRRVQKSVAKKVYSLTSDPIERKSLFAECYRDLKDRFGVGSYKDIRRNDKDKALKYINAWIPRVDAS
ncbi:Rha family transcriptional regulator (plasmid) [Bacillus carboniphilus]|uniref:Rha family transcriptional regulator n=1 Tax=Bacillus carboniphilus TaxID=86663 RepID=A0ABY9JYD9_9BACI|nr:Rha family transcriptional regulator [Bacillus carboniphilus]WLR44424.1 Rha family transcriptional regulator [Bacillus carboniphilus]